MELPSQEEAMKKSAKKLRTLRDQEMKAVAGDGDMPVPPLAGNLATPPPSGDMRTPALRPDEPITVKGG
jgi:hypothetical protein